MLYFFYGTDQKKIQEKTQEIVETLRAKREFAQVFYMHADTLVPDQLEHMQNTQGLFFDKHIFVYKNILGSNKEQREYLLNRIDSYIESPHLHIVAEGDIDQKYINQIEKKDSVKTQVFHKKKFEIQAEDISKKMFATVGMIADMKALSKKERTTVKKIQVWKSVDEIKRKPTAAEEFFGILWWKYRVIMQARNSDQKTSGMTPYAYTQARKQADMYQKRKDDTQALYKDMKSILNIYHDAHNGESEMWEALEAWVLN